MRMLVMSLLAIALVSSVQAQTADNLRCDGCVNSPDIADQAVRTNKLKNGSVTARKLRSGAVTPDKVSPELRNSIGTTCESGQYVIGQDETGNFLCKELDIAELEAKLELLSSIPRFVVVDSEGKFVGYVQQFSSPGSGLDLPELNPFSPVIALVALDDGWVPLIVHKDFIRGIVSAYFAGADCTGQAYAVSSSSFLDPEFLEVSEYAVDTLGNVYKFETDAPSQRISPNYELRISGGTIGGSGGSARRECSSGGDNPLVGSERVGTLPDFVPPFRVEIR